MHWIKLNFPIEGSKKIYPFIVSSMYHSLSIGPKLLTCSVNAEGDHYTCLFACSILFIGHVDLLGRTKNIQARLDLILGKAGSKAKDVYDSKQSLASRIVKVERSVEDIESKLDQLLEMYLEDRRGPAQPVPPRMSRLLHGGPPPPPPPSIAPSIAPSQRSVTPPPMATSSPPPPLQGPLGALGGGQLPDQGPLESSSPAPMGPSPGPLTSFQPPAGSGPIGSSVSSSYPPYSLPMSQPIPFRLDQPAVVTSGLAESVPHLPQYLSQLPLQSQSTAVSPSATAVSSVNPLATLASPPIPSDSPLTTTEQPASPPQPQTQASSPPTVRLCDDLNSYTLYHTYTSVTHVPSVFVSHSSLFLLSLSSRACSN